MKNRARWSIATVLIALLATVAYVINRKLVVAKRIRSGIGMIQPGMAEDAAVAMLGSPTRIQKPC